MNGFTFITLLVTIDQVYTMTNLKYFETFSNIGVSSYIKRSAEGQELIKRIKFRIFQKNFNVWLKSGTKVLAEDFKAHLVHGDGRTTSFLVDQSRLFSGHLIDDPDVSVYAHLEDTLWSIQIFDKNETYAVEPAFNLLQRSQNLNNDTLIAYKGSDLTDSGSKCAAKHPMISNKDEGFHFHYNLSQPRHIRNDSHIRRKKAEAENTCLIYMVGDYDLYKGRCGKNYVTCSSLLISFVHNADNIYSRSYFYGHRNQRIPGLRIQVGMLTMYTTYTVKDTKERRRHFNENFDWDSDAKLRSFAFSAGYIKQPYCHYHLFSQYPMPQRVLGLAYIGSACYRAMRGSELWATGITSGYDCKSGPIPSLQMNLVFVHGHNLGSEHDPGSDECSHDEASGGNYIMWDRAVSGKYPNHKFFSPCSLKQIGRFMESMSCLKRSNSVRANCREIRRFPQAIPKLIPKRKPGLKIQATRNEMETLKTQGYSEKAIFCGNGIVDDGEDCDAGAHGILELDKCCTKSCTFKTGAVCSDSNTACCLDCKMAPNTTVCSDSGTADCKDKSNCTGKSYECPEGDNLPDWTVCRDGGECYHGVCIGFCEMKSIKENYKLKPCFCRSSNEDACKWCCFDVSNESDPGPCRPYAEEILKDGRPCFSGYCEGGLCKRNITSSVKRVFAYLQSLRIPGIVKFMKSNIVSTVILLSLVVWIPLSCIFTYMDTTERNQFENQQNLAYKMAGRKNTLQVMKFSRAGTDSLSSVPGSLDDPDKPPHKGEGYSKEFLSSTPRIYCLMGLDPIQWTIAREDLLHHTRQIIEAQRWLLFFIKICVK